MIEYAQTSSKHKENLISAVSAGFFFILIGLIFITTPTNLFTKVTNFFNDFTTTKIPNTDIYLPAPAHPGIHSTVYTAAAHFCLVWGLFEIAILALRLIARSPLNKKAEATSNIVYWLGSYYLITTILTASLDLKMWFAYWALIITLAGITLIIRAIVLATRI